MVVKTKKIRWKEIRNNGYTRREIIFILILVRLRRLRWFSYRLWYFISKYEHHHVYKNSNLKCLICKKSKMDIDREWLKQKNKEVKTNE